MTGAVIGQPPNDSGVLEQDRLARPSKHARRGRAPVQEGVRSASRAPALKQDGLAVDTKAPEKPVVLNRSSPGWGEGIGLGAWLWGWAGCRGGDYVVRGALAARSSAWACRGVGSVSLSKVARVPGRRIVLRVWVASSAIKVR